MTRGPEVAPRRGHRRPCCDRRLTLVERKEKFQNCMQKRGVRLQGNMDQTQIRILSNDCLHPSACAGAQARLPTISITRRVGLPRSRQAPTTALAHEHNRMVLVRRMSLMGSYQELNLSTDQVCEMRHSGLITWPDSRPLGVTRDLRQRWMLRYRGLQAVQVAGFRKRSKEEDIHHHIGSGNSLRRWIDSEDVGRSRLTDSSPTSTKERCVGTFESMHSEAKSTRESRRFPVTGEAVCRQDEVALRSKRGKTLGRWWDSKRGATANARHGLFHAIQTAGRTGDGRRK